MLKVFLNKIITEDGFILETSDKKNYRIGNPTKKNPAKLKLKNKKAIISIKENPTMPSSVNTSTQ